MTPTVRPAVGREGLFRGACLAGLRALRWAAALDLLLLSLTGGYTLPGTALKSLFPCTSVFLILLTTLSIQWLSRDRRQARAAFLTDVRVFLLVWLVFLSNFRWRGSGDTVAASMEPFALLQQGDLYLDPFFPGDIGGDVSQVYRFGGHVLSKYSSAAGLCLVPFDLLPGLAGVHPTDLFLHQTQKIGASCLVALSVLFLLKALGMFLARPQALGLALLYAFGTSSLSVSSQAIWQHAPGQFFMALGLWAWLSALRDKEGRGAFPGRGAMTAAGFAFGMAVWSRYTNLLVFLPVLAWTAWRRPRRLGAFLLGAAPPCLALIGDNLFHSGHWWGTGYRTEAGEFLTPVLPGLTGSLLSPARGLFLYSPFVLFSLWGCARAWKERRWEFLRPLSLGAAAVVFLCARWHAWDGGWCFGPRLLADLSPIWVLALVPLAPRFWGRGKAALIFWGTAACSVLVHGMGAYLSWWWEDKARSPWSPDRHPLYFIPVDRLSWPGRAAFLLFLTALAWAVWKWSFSRPSGSRRRPEGLAG